MIILSALVREAQLGERDVVTSGASCRAKSQNCDAVREARGSRNGRLAPTGDRISGPAGDTLQLVNPVLGGQLGLRCAERFSNGGSETCQFSFGHCHALSVRLRGCRNIRFHKFTMAVIMNAKPFARNPNWSQLDANQS
jgi:hypothetical protein